MKFYLGRDEKASTMPKFEIKMPAQQLPIGVNGDLGIEGKQQQQQLPFQVPPQAMDMVMAMMKPLMDSEVTQQVLGNVMG